MSGDKSIKDYLYTSEIDEQVDAVPFLGDLYSFADEEFFPVEKKTLLVKSLSVTEDKFVGQVILADVDWSQAPKKFNRVVVGVEISIPRPGKKPLPGSWILTDSEEELIDSSKFNAAVSPGDILVTTYYFQALKRITSKPSTPENFPCEFSFGRNLKEVADSIELTKKKTKDILAQADYRRLISAEGLSEELNNLVQHRIRNISSDNWARLTYFLIKQYDMVHDYIKYSNTQMAYIQNFHKEKHSVIETLRKKSIEYVYTKEQWLRINAENLEIYALMFCQNSWRLNSDIVTFFYDLKSRSSGKNVLFCAFDIRLVNYRVLETPPSAPFQIQRYIKGKCETTDVMVSEGFAKYNLAVFYGDWQKVVPKRRTLLRVACPGNGEKACQGGIREWLCYNCKLPMYYAFELGLFCDQCGAGAIKNFKFRCDAINHFLPIPLTTEQCGELNALPPMAERNILLLGTSGVGKSTWINATCNYMSFKTLENAEMYKAKTPVTSEVYFTDKNMDEWVECVDPNNPNECTTRDCRNCSVVLDDVVFNLIDTPSLGVSNGIDVDRKNIKKILDYVRNIDELHGVCILLNADETKKSARLNYCLKEIFSNLNKGVSENLLFCVTNTRRKNFRSGNTLQFLDRLLERKGLNTSISLEDKMFYVDNEAFNYLCCRRYENSNYSVKNRLDFLKSWAKSAEETTRLLKKVQTLAPHRVVDTLAIYHARVVIHCLVSHIAQTTVKATSNELRAKKLDVERSKIGVDQIHETTTITTYRLKSIPLSHPRTVCISDKCRLLLGKRGMMQILYEQHCHPECYCLQEANVETNHNPALKRCVVIGSNSFCTKCGCSWENHMLMLCEQTLEEVLEEDETHINRMREATAQVEAKQVILQEFEKSIKDRASEREQIITIAGYFAHFLKENAIVSHNDSIGEYLSFLRSKYEEILKIPNDVSQRGRTIQSKMFQGCPTQMQNKLTADNIEEYLQQLYSLPVYGDQLKAAIEMAMKVEES